jgi:hypothetical protein
MEGQTKARQQQMRRSFPFAALEGKDDGEKRWQRQGQQQRQRQKQIQGSFASLEDDDENKGNDKGNSNDKGKKQIQGSSPSQDAGEKTIATTT